VVRRLLNDVGEGLVNGWLLIKESAGVWIPAANLVLLVVLLTREGRCVH
jgi:hypothetical protein